MANQFEGNRKEFLDLLSENPGVFIFKFTAEWCKPCQIIKEDVQHYFQEITSEKIKCFEVDVDENFDLYAFMKTKKMIKGIPMLMAFKKGNIEYYPDNSISGTNLNEIKTFFDCAEKMI